MEKSCGEDNFNFKEIFFYPEDREAKEVLLTLTPKHLTFTKTSSELAFDLKDIIGASFDEVPATRLNHAKGTSGDDVVYTLRIHFSIDNTNSSNSNIQKLNKKTSEYICYTENKNIVLTWRNLILHASNNKDFSDICRRYNNPTDFPQFKRHLLVFINPKSGKGNSADTWKKAKKYLEKAGCEFTEVLTKYYQHAKEFIQKHDASELKKFDGILTVSGDGLPHEVINGIMLRSDWEEIKEIPIGALPGGSGNALVQSLLSKAKRQNTLENACYLVAKGRTIQSDLTVFDKGDNTPIYSFLHFLWGVVSYIDFESEKCRFLGGLRFELYGAIGLLKNSIYKAKITYSNTSTVLPPLNEEINGDEWKSLTDDFTWFNIHNLAYMATDTQAAPLADFQDGYNHFLALHGENCTRKKLMNIWNNIYGGLFEGETPKKDTSLLFEKIKAFRVEPEGDFQSTAFSIDGERYAAGKIQGRVMEKVLKYFYTE